MIDIHVLYTKDSDVAVIITRNPPILETEEKNVKHMDLFCVSERFVFLAF